MNYREYTDEALITMLMDNTNDAQVMEELVRRFRPTILGEALKYRDTLPFDTDDYLQEGRITLWKIALNKNYKTGNFHNYFISAIRFHYCNLYRDYVLKNFIRIGGYEDIRGNTYQILVEAPAAERYREKHREHCRRSAAKRRAAQPPKPQKPKLTEEEKIAQRRARSLAYYYAHADEMNQRAKDKRKAKREAKAAEKAARQRVIETEKLAKKAAKDAEKAARQAAHLQTCPI